ncbi:uncharacterized protein LY89DRAFT_101127 [Mollisia scopiformis]|uniref:Uncharacterized protein n=1 Tax=Mollisia scopiformis TaxID=149040 RepID=A0A194X767_MOLSC|nr:uncharacterized protein LY89DRAFT_101127 [Mollisia scopiformis]KUJ16015.1 hypothetical protein LY89DRAFT_101127 [Mollisia scopiformis]
MQRRLLQHAARCSHLALNSLVVDDGLADEYHNLGILYSVQGKLVEAEQMYQRALQGYEKAWGLEHTSTLDTINNLGLLYKKQGKLVEAEQMYQRALQGYEKAIGPDNITTYVPSLKTILNLGLLFERQADLAKARTMFSEALHGYEQVFGPDHAKSENLRDYLYDLDVGVENEASIQIEERADHLQVGSSHFGIKKPPSISKRHSCFCDGLNPIFGCTTT